MSSGIYDSEKLTGPEIKRYYEKKDKIKNNKIFQALVFKDGIVFQTQKGRYVCKRISSCRYPSLVGSLLSVYNLALCVLTSFPKRHGLMRIFI
jgi:hypothetical protein